jgi:Glycine zipper
MGKRHDRLTKYGIVALAGIAVLGWVREPEKHQHSGSAVKATTSPTGTVEPRPTFYPPSAGARIAGLDELPGDNPGSAQASEPVRKAHPPVTSAPENEGAKRSPIEVHQQPSTVVKPAAQAPVHSGRHEGPQVIEEGVVTRSREPQREHPEDPETTTERVVRSSDRPQNGGGSSGPQVNRTDDIRAQTQQPVVRKKERSTARSAAIMVGTAVAGAAIGAATGGGKGAAIGAISGGAGGYVYDRMTRRNGIPNGAPGVVDKDSPSDRQSDSQHYDLGPSLARRFGTPSFSGR